jgi:hypothetical protein
MPAAGSSISKSFGFVGERDRKFEPLEIAVGELTATALRMVGHADESQQPLRLSSVVARRPAERWPAARMIRKQRHLDILRDRHRGEVRSDLERPSNAETPDVAIGATMAGVGT